jgi:hypothetical protein
LYGGPHGAARGVEWTGARRGADRGEKKPGKISKKPTVTPIMAWESLI